MRARSVLIVGIFVLVCVFSCSRPERVKNTPVQEIQFDLPPQNEQPVVRILSYRNSDEGAVLVPWLRSYIENGISGPESLIAYRGFYLFIASVRSVNFSVINQWIRNYSYERDFSRLVAKRIQGRLNMDLPGRPPDMVYGPNYVKAVIAAYNNDFWGSRRLGDTWVLGIKEEKRGDEETAEPEKPMYWAFILVSIPRETLEIQITELLSKITNSSTKGGVRATKEQNAAFDRVKEYFFEKF